jgi:hypothetical protein
MMGAHGLAGPEIALSRGGLFEEAGHLWGRLQVEEAEGLMGGLTLDLGHRFRL